MEKLDENLFTLNSKRYGSQIWATCVLRRRSVCRACGVMMVCGHTALRPLTIAGNRFHRLHTKMDCLKIYDAK